MDKIKSIAIYTFAALLFETAPCRAQITIPYGTFVNGTTADADQINSDFSALSTQALNRTGGTITGNIVVSGGVTIDGVDVGAVLGGTGSPTFASLTVSGGITAGSGVVGIVDGTGKIPALSSTYFASLSGANLTTLNASNLSSGTVPLAQLTGITDTQISGAAAIAWTKISKAGSSLIDLATRSATDLTSGTLPSGRLSGTYSNTLVFSGAVTQSGGLTRSANYVTDSSATSVGISGGSQTVDPGTSSVLFVTPTAGTDSIATINGGVEGRLLTVCIVTTQLGNFFTGGNIAASTSAYGPGTCAQFIYHAGLWYGAH